MNKIFKRFFQVLSVGTFSLTSCMKMYGIPVDIDYYKAVKVLTETNIPIKDLSVKLIAHPDTFSGGTTNSEGVVTFDYAFYNESSYSVFIEDIDGEENQGNFISKEVNLTEPDTTIVQMKKQ